MTPLPPAANLPLYKTIDYTSDRTQMPPQIRALDAHLAPSVRPRRLRQSTAMRELVSEVHVHPKQLILPVFVDDAIDTPVDISSMPGVQRHSLESIKALAVTAAESGIGGLMIFGVPATADKDEYGSVGWEDSGILNRALRVVGAEVGDELVVMADTCLDEFTSHGHCGLLSERGKVDNDATLACYQAMAVAQARAGAQVVSPSGMMDGQVAAIRAALDAEGFTNTAILAYAAKYASAFFGPFREAVNSDLHGDRREYQQDPANRREGLRETQADIDQGADLVMVKPAGYYLDVLSDVAAISPVPVAAYQVSGEYSMVAAAAAQGWIDRRAVVSEQLTSIVRAGANLVLTYWATEAAKWLR